MSNEYKQTSPSTQQVVHTIVEHSSKLLADTILEMGVLACESKRTILNLTEELRWATEKYQTLQREFEKTKVFMDETNKRFVDSCKELTDNRVHLDAVRLKIKQTHESYEYYMAKAKAELIARDVIIDQLLETYDISRTDKRKIKKLRVEGAPTK